MLGTGSVFLIRLCSSDVSLLHSDVQALHGYAKHNESVIIERNSFSTRDYM